MKSWTRSSAFLLVGGASPTDAGYSRKATRCRSILRIFAAVVIRLLLRVYHRYEIVGQERLRLNGSFVLVANHCSHLDTICLLSALPLRQLHQTYPAAAADYFFKSRPRYWLATTITNALPFWREAHVRQTLATCQQILARPGSVLILFPEGTRSQDGELQTFKSGIGSLVAGRNIKVVPCRLEGTHAAWPKGRPLPRPAKLRLVVGKPRTYFNYKADRHSADEIATELEEAVRNLAANRT